MATATKETPRLKQRYESELKSQLRAVTLFETGSHQSSFPHLRQMRCFVPSVAKR